MASIGLRLENFLAENNPGIIIKRKLIDIIITISKNVSLTGKTSIAYMSPGSFIKPNNF